MDVTTLMNRLPVYTEVFHENIVPQHCQYYFFNRQHNQAAFMQKLSASYSGLNNANLLLGRFFRAVNEKCKNSGKVPEPVIDEVDGHLNEWRKFYKAGAVYGTFPYAQKIYQLLLVNGYPIREEIAGNRELLDAFTNIPYPVKATFQIEVMVSEPELIPLLEKGCNFLSKKPSFAYYFTEMTIPEARPVTGNQTASLYAIKFKLLPEIISTYRNPLVNEAIDAIVQWNEEITNTAISKKEFTIEISNNISIAQGNNNYKKFLNLLGILDTVYDRNFGFAYLLNK